MRKGLCMLSLFSLVLVSLSGRVLADGGGSSATAYADLSWSSASFSGAVTPGSSGPAVNPYATYTGAAGYGSPGYLPSSFVANDDSPAGWVPALATVQFGPQDYAMAAVNTDLTTLATGV